MKKIICTLLALVMLLSCLAVMTSCKKDKGDDSETPLIYDIIKNSDPTKIVTDVTYTDSLGEDLGGFYEMEIDGEDSIFTFTYRRYRTPEEGAAEGNTDPVKELSGKVYYKDHLYYASEGSSWNSSAATGSDLKLDIQESYLTDATVSEDGTTLTATLTSANAISALGTDLSVAEGGVINITVTTNGTNLTGILLTCTTGSGAEVVIRTSYSYNPITLVFPEA